MSRRAGERRDRRPAPTWPGPLPWSQLRPGDEFALAIVGEPPQWFRVIALSLTDTAMAPPNVEGGDPILTLVVGILADPLSERPAQRLIVTAVAVTRRR